MKEYRILCNTALYMEVTVNMLAEQGFVIDKVVQQGDNSKRICIIMVREKPEENKHIEE